MLLENIRQSCIKQSYSEETDTYWGYMISFSDKCADPISPKFNEDCAESVMKERGIDIDKVNKCMAKEASSKFIELC